MKVQSIAPLLGPRSAAFSVAIERLVALGLVEQTEGKETLYRIATPVTFKERAPRS